MGECDSARSWSDCFFRWGFQMSNLRSDCRDLVKDRPAGDVWRTHVEALCHQIDELEERWHKTNRRIKSIRDSVETVVCTVGEDKGVILLSEYGATKYDEELKCQVYIHEHFSPLGDAMIAIHEMCVIE